jgi:hypothetical protein
MRVSDAPCEVLKCRCTYTATGYPVDLADLHPSVVAVAPEPGWFWMTATPRSAARIRRDGHKAVGALVTTWIPPQDGGSVHPVDEPEGAWRPTYNEDNEVVGVRHEW